VASALGAQQSKAERLQSLLQAGQGHTSSSTLMGATEGGAAVTVTGAGGRGLLVSQ
jgi:hypothetical protein